MSKQIPTATVAALIRVNYCYVVLTEAALRDISNLPQDPYKEALALAKEQLATLVPIHVKRTNEARTEKLLASIEATVYPTPPQETEDVEEA